MYSSWLEINKNALTNNISQYKAITNNEIVAPVIKGNAYGHGLLQVAYILEENKDIDWLCVSHLSEALFLRKRKIKKPILVLSCIDANPIEAIDQDIIFTIGSSVNAQKLSAIGKKYNYYFSVHVKVDTGLSRFGVMPQGIIAYIQYVRTLGYLKIDGIFSHFAQAADLGKDVFTAEQLNRFNKVLKKLAQCNINIPYRHMSNSAAMLFNQPLCNFLRIGLGIYGYWPSQINKFYMKKKYPHMILKPAMTWKTRIMEIKNVPANSKIGYGCTYKARKLMRIAILPIGYYDGYQMRFSNKTWVKIKKQYAPVIGRICMNATIVDISKIPFAAVGDEVIVLGNYPKLNAWDLAGYAEAANVREILSSINPSIPRITV